MRIGDRERKKQIFRNSDHGREIGDPPLWPSVPSPISSCIRVRKTVEVVLARVEILPGDYEDFREANSRLILMLMLGN